MSVDQSSDAGSDSGAAASSVSTGGFSDGGMGSMTGGGGSGGFGGGGGAGGAYAAFQVPIANAYREAQPGSFKHGGQSYAIAGAYPAQAGDPYGGLGYSRFKEVARGNLALSLPPTIKKYWWVFAGIIGSIVVYWMYQSFFKKGKRRKK